MSFAQTSSKVELLAASSLFAGLNKRQLAALNRHLDEVRIPAGRTIINQGSVGYEACVVLDGTVAIQRDGALLETAGAGVVFGEMAMIDKGIRTASVVAITDVVLAVLGPRSFDLAIEEIPGLAKVLLQNMSRRLRTMDERLVAA
jgi:CRP/FNR family transcriptional regulator, cyclic AMP receptor protein